MSTDRFTRLNEQLRREISAGIFRVIHEADVDMATITVTRVILSRDLRHARIFVSVRADEDMQDRVISLLGRYHHEFQSIINKDLMLKYIPRLTFQLDASIEKGSHVLDILSKIEDASPTADESGRPGE